MSKRKYTKIKEIEPEIVAMREEGKTLREIAVRFGLEKKQLKDLVTRYNRRQKKMEAGIMPKLKGRPRKDGQALQQNEKRELEQLRMENKLLRDFLQLAGRK